MEQRQCVLYGLGNTAYEPGSGRGAGGIGVAASRRFVHSTGRLEGISGRLTGHFPQYALSVLVRAVCAFGVDGRDFCVVTVRHRPAVEDRKSVAEVTPV